MTSAEALVLLKLSIQGALIGAVTPNLAAVTCGLRDNTILIQAYFDGPVTEEDIERIQVVGTEVIADFPEPFLIEERWASVDGDPEMLDFWAFKRAADR